LSHARVREQFN